MEKRNDRIRVSEEISVRELFDTFKEPLQLELLAGEGGLDKVILETGLNRPALAITGYYKNFASNRIQLFGAGEMAYMCDLDDARQREVMEEMISHSIPCIVVSRGLQPTQAMLDAVRAHNVPLIGTKMKSKEFSSEVLVRIGMMFAPRTSVHGTLLDVKGVGVLIRGDSGIGKSECALGLIDHGHSLVADDHVNCVKINEQRIVGSGSELNRGYMECRGIGIINVAEIFGIRCVRLEKTIDLVVTFIEWQPGIVEDRTGLERNYFDIMGVAIPNFIIPVRPGRDMTRLVEVSAMVQALRRMGHDGAKDFNDKLIAHMSQKGKK